MHEKRVRGGGSSAAPRRLGPGLVVLCLWLGSTTPQVMVAATPLAPLKRTGIEYTPDIDAETKNIQLSISFSVDQRLDYSGDLSLISKDGRVGLQGTYEAKDGVLTTTFKTERDWQPQSYQYISGGPFGTQRKLRSAIEVPAIKTKALTVVPDPGSTTGETITFRASATKIPSGDSSSLCDGGLYLLQSQTSESEDWQISKNSELSLRAQGFELTFQLDRPSEPKPDCDVVLELCQGSNRFVYRGNLPKAIPSMSYEIKVQWQKREGPDQTLVLRIPNRPAKQTKILEARVVKGTDEIPALKRGSSVTFHSQEDSYRAEIPFNCSSGNIKLPKLSLTARDSRGEYLFESSQEETLCSELVLPRNLSGWLLVVALSIVLAVCAVVYRHKIRAWFRRDRASESTSPQTPPPLPSPGKEVGAFPNSFPETWKSGLEGVLKSQLASLHGALQEVKNVLSQVPNHQLQFPGTGGPAPAYDGIDVEEQGGSSASLYGQLQAQPRDTLTDLVSRWWAEGANRDRLDDLILQNPSIKPYRSSNVQDSMRSPTNRTFIFQPAQGQAEWLGRVQQGDLFVVPGDPKLFQTGDSLKFLGVLFEGLGSSLSNVRFRRVLKACRLRKEPGFTDRYRVAERGLLELEGGPAAETFTSPRPAPARAPQPAPVAQPLLPTELANVVRDAVGAAIPSGLTSQIQDLSLQLRDLAQGGLQRNEAPRMDTSVTADLAAVRRDLAALGQRMNAFEDMAQALEALRRSLAGIEGGLREFHSQQLDPAPPAASTPAPAPPDVVVRGLRSEPWMEEIREEMKDVIPEAVSPSYPQATTVPDQLEAPERLWARLQTWWPSVLNSRIPDGYYAGDPSTAYFWSLNEVRSALSRASADRGWQVEVVHVKVPDNSPAGERILQIHEPNSIEEQRVVCTCVPTSPFTGLLLFQFALRVRGDQGQDIAVLPAPGLRLAGSTEGYARLAGGKLQENATLLTAVIRPAILSQTGTGDLYTVVLPMQAKFR